MACNIAYAYAETNTAQLWRPAAESQEKEEAKKNPFSEPWEESDLILVVENEKFHVHRLILSMNSPVFKAMFKSQFKEATSNEIPLPEKKASEMLDFLKQLYIQEQKEVTMGNVEHLLKLSDEYQVKPIFDSCSKFLEKQSIKEDNVMKILMLSAWYKLENVRQSCFNFSKDMKLQSILKKAQQEDLDTENLKNILSHRVERLETFLDKVFPEFMGMVECCLWLWYEGERDMKWCQHHFSDGTSDTNIDERIAECKVCQNMLDTIIKGTRTYVKSSGRYVPRGHVYGGSLHFSNQLPKIILEFSKLTKFNSW